MTIPNVTRFAAPGLGSYQPRLSAPRRKDLLAMSAWKGEASSPEEASRAFLSEGRGRANLAAADWQAAMRAAGLSHATINRRVSTLRAIAREAHRAGAIDWLLDCPSLRVIPVRASQGPTEDEARRILAAARTPRERALVLLAGACGFRRAEILGLQVGDFDPGASTVAIRAKGWDQRRAEPVPPVVASALAELAEGKGAEAPLFPGQKGAALSPAGLRKALAALGKRAGVEGRVNPHAFRHSAVTSALEAGCTTRAVASAYRMTERIVQRYDDRRRQAGENVTATVAARLQKETG